ncbi:MAG: hypothetical protein PPP58_00850 [Natronomonas sp.]
MGAVSTSLDERARSIFTDLGYEITDTGTEFRAERKWRTVHVTTQRPVNAPTHGQFRCFVADAEHAGEIQTQLSTIEPDYDWAVVAVDESSYEVLHPSADVLPAP